MIIKYNVTIDTIIEFIKYQDDSTSIQDYTLYDFFCYVATAQDITSRANASIKAIGITDIINIRAERHQSDKSSKIFKKISQQYPTVHHTQLRTLLWDYTPPPKQKK